MSQHNVFRQLQTENKLKCCFPFNPNGTECIKLSSLFILRLSNITNIKGKLTTTRDVYVWTAFIALSEACGTQIK